MKQLFRYVFSFVFSFAFGVASIAGIASIAMAQETKSLKIDKSRSEISFIAEAIFSESDKGKLGYTVKGVFSNYETKLKLGASMENSKVQFKVKTDSITTAAIKTENTIGGVHGILLAAVIKAAAAANSLRDKRLKSVDFFDSANFPDATFKSSGIVMMSGSQFIMKGLLTLRGVPQDIEFIVEPKNNYQSPDGKNHTVFAGSAEINRIQFGIGLESGTTEVMGQQLYIKDQITLNVLLDTYEESAP